MKAKAIAAVVVICCLLSPAHAQENDRCIRQFEAEAARIEREYMKSPPAAGAQEAAVAWSKGLHTALEQVARKAEECSAEAARAAAPQRRIAEQECSRQAHRGFEDLTRRYGSGHLSTAEQVARREEELRLNDALNACLAAARRR